MGHGKGDVLPVALGQDVLLCCNPLFGGLEAAGTAGFWFAAMAEETGMDAVGWGTTVAAKAHGTGAAGEHALDGEFCPVAEGVTVFIEKSAPAVIVQEEQFCKVRNIHSAEYKTGQKRLWLQGYHAYANH